MTNENKITLKVALPGEGKTRWLAEVAHEFIKSEGRTVYLFTTQEDDYIKFCDNYFKRFNTVCQVSRLMNINDVTDKDVVIVDNLLSHTDARVSDFADLTANCYKMFITMEGTSAQEPEVS